MSALQKDSAHSALLLGRQESKLQESKLFEIFARLSALKKVSFVLEEQNQISKSADTRANYKDLSALTSDLPLGLSEYMVMGTNCADYGDKLHFFWNLTSGLDLVNFFRFVPIVPRICPDGPRNCPDGPRICPDGPRICPDVPKICPDVPKNCPDVPKKYETVPMSRICTPMVWIVV